MARLLRKSRSSIVGNFHPCIRFLLAIACPTARWGDKFAGRVAAQCNIYDTLHQDNTAIVQGIGVVVQARVAPGKTQAVIEYAYRFGASYPGRRLLGGCRPRLGYSYQPGFGRGRCRHDTKAEEEHTELAQLWRELNQLPPLLLVLDNFPRKDRLACDPGLALSRASAFTP